MEWEVEGRRLCQLFGPLTLSCYGWPHGAGRPGEDTQAKILPPSEAIKRRSTMVAWALVPEIFVVVDRACHFAAQRNFATNAIEAHPECCWSASESYAHGRPRSDRVRYRPSHDVDATTARTAIEHVATSAELST